MLATYPSNAGTAAADLPLVLRAWPALCRVRDSNDSRLWSESDSLMHASLYTIPSSNARSIDSWAEHTGTPADCSVRGQLAPSLTAAGCSGFSAATPLVPRTAVTLMLRRLRRIFTTSLLPIGL
jgi:hypothetical protein